MINRFSVPCITAALIALVSSLRFSTDSEDEELEGFQNMPLHSYISTIYLFFSRCSRAGGNNQSQAVDLGTRCKHC